MFVNQTEEKVKKNYSNDDSITNDFTRIKKEYFNKYFEYQFFYYLRNFSQHDKNVIQNVRYDPQKLVIRSYSQKCILLKNTGIRHPFVS